MTGPTGAGLVPLWPIDENPLAESRELSYIRQRLTYPLNPGARTGVANGCCEYAGQCADIRGKTVLIFAEAMRGTFAGGRGDGAVLEGHRRQLPG